MARFEQKKAENQARFVSMMVDEKLSLGKKTEQQINDLLDELSFDRLVSESKKVSFFLTLFKQPNLFFSLTMLKQMTQGRK